MFKKIISLFLSLSLIITQPIFAQGVAHLNMAQYLGQARPAVIDIFRPTQLRYFSYDDIKNSFRILLDKGDAKDIKDNQFKQEARELMDYFLIGLTLPNDAFWVNLRPDSPENIIDPELEKTDLGRILLEADLQLKKDTAGLTSPQTAEGKAYWDKLYKKAGELFGTENITIPTITRPWIVPGEIIVRESGASAYIYKATLKVLLEQDHLKDSSVYNFSDPRLKELNEYSSQIIRETIIPKLTQEVNSSKRYAKLRQVYYSLVLSRWFKQKYSSLRSIRASEHQSASADYISLIDSGNLTNLTVKEPYDKLTYFKQYQESFAKGEYSLKEPVYTPYGQSIRSYMSGGFNGTKIITAGVNAPETAGSSILGESLKNRPDLLQLEISGDMQIKLAGNQEQPKALAASPVVLEDEAKAILRLREKLKEAYNEERFSHISLSHLISTVMAIEDKPVLNESISKTELLNIETKLNDIWDKVGQNIKTYREGLADFYTKIGQKPGGKIYADYAQIIKVSYDTDKIIAAAEQAYKLAHGTASPVEPIAIKVIWGQLLNELTPDEKQLKSGIINYNLLIVDNLMQPPKGVSADQADVERFVRQIIDGKEDFLNGLDVSRKEKISKKYDEMTMKLSQVLSSAASPLITLKEKINEVFEAIEKKINDPGLRNYQEELALFLANFKKDLEGPLGEIDAIVNTQGTLKDAIKAIEKISTILFNKENEIGNIHMDIKSKIVSLRRYDLRSLMREIEKSIGQRETTASPLGEIKIAAKEAIENAGESLRQYMLSDEAQNKYNLSAEYIDQLEIIKLWLWLDGAVKFFSDGLFNPEAADDAGRIVLSYKQFIEELKQHTTASQKLIKKIYATFKARTIKSPDDAEALLNVLLAMRREEGISKEELDISIEILSPRQADRVIPGWKIIETLKQFSAGEMQSRGISDMQKAIFNILIDDKYPGCAFLRKERLEHFLRYAKNLVEKNYLDAEAVSLMEAAIKEKTYGKALNIVMNLSKEKMGQALPEEVAELNKKQRNVDIDNSIPTLGRIVEAYLNNKDSFLSKEEKAIAGNMYATSSAASPLEPIDIKVIWGQFLNELTPDEKRLKSGIINYNSLIVDNLMQPPEGVSSAKKVVERFVNQIKDEQGDFLNGFDAPRKGEISKKYDEMTMKLSQILSSAASPLKEIKNEAREILREADPGFEVYVKYRNLKLTPKTVDGFGDSPDSVRQGLMEMILSLEEVIQQEAYSSSYAIADEASRIHKIFNKLIDRLGDEMPKRKAEFSASSVELDVGFLNGFYEIISPVYLKYNKDKKIHEVWEKIDKEFSKMMREANGESFKSLLSDTNELLKPLAANYPIVQEAIARLEKLSKDLEAKYKLDENSRSRPQKPEGRAASAIELSSLKRGVNLFILKLIDIASKDGNVKGSPDDLAKSQGDLEKLAEDTRQAFDNFRDGDSSLDFLDKFEAARKRLSDGVKIFISDLSDSAYQKFYEKDGISDQYEDLLKQFKDIKISKYQEILEEIVDGLGNDYELADELIRYVRESINDYKAEIASGEYAQSQLSGKELLLKRIAVVSEKMSSEDIITEEAKLLVNAWKQHQSSAASPVVNYKSDNPAESIIKAYNYIFKRDMINGYEYSIITESFNYNPMLAAYKLGLIIKNKLNTNQIKKDFIARYAGAYDYGFIHDAKELDKWLHWLTINDVSRIREIVNDVLDNISSMLSQGSSLNNSINNQRIDIDDIRNNYIGIIEVLNAAIDTLNMELPTTEINRGSSNDDLKAAELELRKLLAIVLTEAIISKIYDMPKFNDQISIETCLYINDFKSALNRMPRGLYMSKDERSILTKALENLPGQRKDYISINTAVVPAGKLLMLELEKSMGELASKLQAVKDEFKLSHPEWIESAADLIFFPVYRKYLKELLGALAGLQDRIEETKKSYNILISAGDNFGHSIDALMDSSEDLRDTLFQVRGYLNYIFSKRSRKFKGSKLEVLRDNYELVGDHFFMSGKEILNEYFPDNYKSLYDAAYRAFFALEKYEDNRKVLKNAWENYKTDPASTASPVVLEDEVAVIQVVREKLNKYHSNGIKDFSKVALSDLITSVKGTAVETEQAKADKETEEWSGIAKELSGIQGRVRSNMEIYKEKLVDFYANIEQTLGIELSENLKSRYAKYAQTIKATNDPDEIIAAAEEAYKLAHGAAASPLTQRQFEAEFYNKIAKSMLDDLQKQNDDPLYRYIGVHKSRYRSFNENNPYEYFAIKKVGTELGSLRYEKNIFEFISSYDGYDVISTDRDTLISKIESVMPGLKYKITSLGVDIDFKNSKNIPALAGPSIHFPMTGNQLKEHLNVIINKLRKARESITSLSKIEIYLYLSAYQKNDYEVSMGMSKNSIKIMEEIQKKAASFSGRILTSGDLKKYIQTIIKQKEILNYLVMSATGINVPELNREAVSFDEEGEGILRSAIIAILEARDYVTLLDNQYKAYSMKKQEDRASASYNNKDITASPVEFEALKNGLLAKIHDSLDSAAIVEKVKNIKSLKELKSYMEELLEYYTKEINEADKQAQAYKVKSESYRNYLSELYKKHEINKDPEDVDTAFIEMNKADKESLKWRRKGDKCRIVISAIKAVLSASPVRQVKLKDAGPADFVKGGIDFTDQAMKIGLEWIGSFADLKLVLPEVSNAAAINLDNEFKQIQLMASSGIRPSDERILEFEAACYYRGEFSARLGEITACLQQAHFLDERLGRESSEALRLATLLPEVM